MLVYTTHIIGSIIHGTVKKIIIAYHLYLPKILRICTNNYLTDIWLVDSYCIHNNQKRKLQNQKINQLINILINYRQGTTLVCKTRINAKATNYKNIYTSNRGYFHLSGDTMRIIQY